MRQLLGYRQLPDSIREQIRKVVSVWQKHMKDELTGIYLHGSIVLNAFNPDSGDIDLLIVVKGPIPTAKRLEIARDIIAIDQRPRPLEMSAITENDAKNWKNPGNCVFHYSDFWTERYMERFADPEKEVYVADQDFPDADVTSYIRLIRQSGIVLYGKDINEVFAEVSDEDFWNAISADTDDYDFHNYDQRYFTSNILILGRILSFKVTGRILSKYEAGAWMKEYVPQELKYIPEQAMKVWFDGEEHEFPEKDLTRLKDFLLKEIKKGESMRIETERLILRELSPDMAQDLHENSLDEDNRRFVPDEVFETPEEARETIEFLMTQYGTDDGPLVYAAITKAGENIGYVQLAPVDEGWEIGYHIAKKYTGKGYATEAVKAFLPEIARMKKINGIYGICLKENAASEKVMDKCGFVNLFTGVGPYQGQDCEIVKNIWYMERNDE